MSRAKLVNNYLWYDSTAVTIVLICEKRLEPAAETNHARPFQRFFSSLFFFIALVTHYYSFLAEAWSWWPPPPPPTPIGACLPWMDFYRVIGSGFPPVARRLWPDFANIHTLSRASRDGRILYNIMEAINSPKRVFSSTTATQTPWLLSPSELPWTNFRGLLCSWYHQPNDYCTVGGLGPNEEWPSNTTESQTLHRIVETALFFCSSLLLHCCCCICLVPATPHRRQ